jgi:hypothetical protein
VSDAPAGLFNSYAVGVDYAPPGRPGPAPTAAAPVFDPGEHTVAEVHDYLAAHPGDADQVLAAEAAGKNRVTLVGD